MPQMAPYSWMILFLYFNLIMYIYISNNHFTWKIPFNTHKNKFNLKFKFKWMW